MSWAARRARQKRPIARRTGWRSRGKIDSDRLTSKLSKIIDKSDKSYDTGKNRRIDNAVSAMVRGAAVRRQAAVLDAAQRANVRIAKAARKRNDTEVEKIHEYSALSAVQVEDDSIRENNGLS